MIASENGSSNSSNSSSSSSESSTGLRQLSEGKKDEKGGGTLKSID